MRVALTGSFAGQDSLGDECLLKSVVARLRHHRPDVKIEFQLNDPRNPFIIKEAISSDFDVERGLQYSMHRLAHLLGRLHIPSYLLRRVSEQGIGVAAYLDLFGVRDAVQRLKRSDAFFVFGGTQFAGQWFKLNAPSYLCSAEIVRDAGGCVFFGPQQFGPLAEEDAQKLRRYLSEVVSDWRTRNNLDAELLESDVSRRAARIVYDEVFSATRAYPSLSRQAFSYLLFNLRHMTFDDETILGVERYRAFAALVDSLVKHYRLPAVFFGMSGATFCDDDAAFDAVRQLSNSPDMLSNIGRVRDEHHLFELARAARVTVSMSFHGCILAGIAGVPFVPVTEGNYYDYKYAEFDKYTANQGVPLVSLSDCNVARDLDRISNFVDRFDPEAVADARHVASDLTDEFYVHAVGAA